MNDDDQHRWIDGVLVADEYTNWSWYHEPDNGNNNYMALKENWSGDWADFGARSDQVYICEKGLIP